jgi:serine-aspartate repeat-containing protein C/D/E
MTHTDSGGYYKFRVETEGQVQVSAGLPAGYFRTTPESILIDATLEVTKTVIFGYAPLTSTFGVIYGTVFEDSNHNGTQNSGEKGIAGVTITSDEAANSPATTQAEGQYTLRYDVAGSVTLTETHLSSYYVSTTADVVHTSVVTGSSNGSPINFGDFLGIKITGMVFEDANVNGLKDTGEGGVAGATITVDGSSDTTAGDGQYTLFLKPANSNRYLW